MDNGGARNDVVQRRKGRRRDDRLQDDAAQQNPAESAAAGYVFAGVIMIVVGCFQAIVGLAALFEDEFFVVSPNYVFEVDTTTWGWIHLLLGLLVAFAGTRSSLRRPGPA